MAQQGCPERHQQLLDETTTDWVKDVPGNFTGEEQARLRRVRRAVLDGTRSEYYPVDRRQDFVRWLIEQGKLSEN